MELSRLFANTPRGGSAPQSVERLSALFRPRSVAAGRHVFREGESVNQIYFITQGEVALEMDVPGRGRQRILSLGAGDLLGWSPLLGGAVMSASAVAMENCELLAAPAKEILALCSADHEVGYHLMTAVAKSLAERLIATRLQLVDLFGEGATSSLAGESNVD